MTGRNNLPQRGVEAIELLREACINKLAIFICDFRASRDT